ncbi:MAG: hypothetical protein JWL97_3513, partial [Gemmatimonadales bacterium]|nr:hypothetical protein [Gemmatimonadales bacterium]
PQPAAPAEPAGRPDVPQPTTAAEPVGSIELTRDFPDHVTVGAEGVADAINFLVGIRFLDGAGGTDEEKSALAQRLVRMGALRELFADIPTRDDPDGLAQAATRIAEATTGTGTEGQRIRDNALKLRDQLRAEKDPAKRAELAKRIARIPVSDRREETRRALETLRNGGLDLRGLADQIETSWQDAAPLLGKVSEILGAHQETDGQRWLSSFEGAYSKYLDAVLPRMRAGVDGNGNPINGGTPAPQTPSVPGDVAGIAAELRAVNPPHSAPGSDQRDATAWNLTGAAQSFASQLAAGHADDIAKADQALADRNAKFREANADDPAKVAIADHVDELRAAGIAAHQRDNPVQYDTTPLPAGPITSVDALRERLRLVAERPGMRNDHRDALKRIAADDSLILSPGGQLFARRQGKGWSLSTATDGIGIGQESRFARASDATNLMGRLETQMIGADGKPFEWNADSATLMDRIKTWQSDQGETFPVAVKRIVEDHNAPRRKTPPPAPPSAPDSTPTPEPAASSVEPDQPAPVPAAPEPPQVTAPPAAADTTDAHLEDIPSTDVKVGDLITVDRNYIDGRANSAMDDSPSTGDIRVTGRVSEMRDRRPDGDPYVVLTLTDAQWHAADGTSGPLRETSSFDQQVPGARVFVNALRPVKIDRATTDEQNAKVEQLTAEAVAARKAGDYPRSLDALDQIIAIDPNPVWQTRRQNIARQAANASPPAPAAPDVSADATPDTTPATPELAAAQSMASGRVPLDQVKPITDADIRSQIEGAYTPMQALLVLSGDRTPWVMGKMRPAAGLNGMGSDGVFLRRDNDKQGMNVRLTGYDGDQPAWERTGQIPWLTAERLIKRQATPEKAAALKDAIVRETTLRREGRHDEAAAASLESLRAWHAIIRPDDATTPAAAAPDVPAPDGSRTGAYDPYQGPSELQQAADRVTPAGPNPDQGPNPVAEAAQAPAAPTVPGDDAHRARVAEIRAQLPMTPNESVTIGQTTVTRRFQSTGRGSVGWWEAAGVDLNRQDRQDRGKVAEAIAAAETPDAQPADNAAPAAPDTTAAAAPDVSLPPAAMPEQGLTFATERSASTNHIYTVSRDGQPIGRIAQIKGTWRWRQPEPAKPARDRFDTWQEALDALTGSTPAAPRPAAGPRPTARERLAAGGAGIRGNQFAGPSQTRQTADQAPAAGPPDSPVFPDGVPAPASVPGAPVDEAHRARVEEIRQQLLPMQPNESATIGGTTVTRRFQSTGGGSAGWWEVAGADLNRMDRQNPGKVADAIARAEAPPAAPPVNRVEASQRRIEGRAAWQAQQGLTDPQMGRVVAHSQGEAAARVQTARSAGDGPWDWVVRPSPDGTGYDLQSPSRGRDATVEQD